LELLPELFDTLGINYSVIDAKGNYLIQNNLAIKEISEGLMNAQEIDEPTWLDCKRIMKTGKKEIKTELFKNRYMFSVKQPIMENKICIGIMVLSLDVTNQKQAELALIEQTKKTQLAARRNVEFLSLASHEIRGPMGNVISILEMIKKYFISQNLDEKEKKYRVFIEDALSESNNAISSIDYLLKLLALFREGLKSELTACNIRSFIENLIRTHEKSSVKNMIFKSDIDTALPEEVMFDFYHLREILDILVTNAIKYSYEDEIITLKVDKIGKSLIFTVKDTGIGISKPHLENLLIPFISNLEENLDENKIMQYRKPSIKLYYIKTMLDYMSGSISVKSKQRKGTEITLTIPFFETTSKTRKAKPQHYREKTPTLENLNILLVEDNPVTLEIEKTELEQLTKTIDATENGLDAVTLAQNKAYDIIFLDITLGDITGIEVMQKIESQYTDKNKAPYFVAVTSRASEDDVDFFITQGFTTVLTKPATKSDFYNCIKTILKIKQSED